MGLEAVEPSWRAFFQGFEFGIDKVEKGEFHIPSFDGVNKAFAIQAGRELRVMVESEKVSDDLSKKLSFEISQKIQTEMTYPGQVKVTVIRETRSVNVAT